MSDEQQTVITEDQEKEQREQVDTEVKGTQAVPDNKVHDQLLVPTAGTQASVNTDATIHKHPGLDKSTAEEVLASDPNHPKINNQGMNTSHFNQPGNTTPASFPRQAPPTTTAEQRGEIPGPDGKFHKKVQG